MPICKLVTFELVQIIYTMPMNTIMYSSHTGSCNSHIQALTIYILSSKFILAMLLCIMYWPVYIPSWTLLKPTAIFHTPCNILEINGLGVTWSPCGVFGDKGNIEVSPSFLQLGLTWVCSVMTWVFTPKYPSCTRVHMVSLGFTWHHSGSLGVTQIHLVSLRFTWHHLGSLGFTRFHLASLRFTQFHLVSLGLIWVHLVSLGRTWLHLGHSGVQS
jgi:hypothetical protein